MNADTVAGCLDGLVEHGIDPVVEMVAAPREHSPIMFVEVAENQV